MREVARSHPTCLTFLELCDPKDRNSNKSPAAAWFKTGKVGKLVLGETEVGKFWIRVGYPVYRSVISTLRLFLFSLALSPSGKEYRLLPQNCADFVSFTYLDTL